MLNRIYPDRNKFKRWFDRFGITCLYCDIPCDMDTPLSVFSRFLLNSHSFLLESAEGGIRWGRYSFISPSAKFIIKGYRNFFEVNGKKRRTKDAFRDLREFVSKFRFPKLKDFPPFIGGAVGVIAYDIVNQWEKVGYKEISEPLFYFVLPEIVIVFDHFKNFMRIFCWVYDRKDLDYVKTSQRIEDILSILKNPLKPHHKSFDEKKLKLKSSVTKKEFEKMVKIAKKYITEGECIQTVLSQYWEVEVKEDPVFIYRALRMINPSPYMYYLRFANTHIIGSSPEILVKKVGRRAIVRPIAGTRPRGKDFKEDKILEKQLVSDEKERAEHLMLVDLARNDLGRVSEFGSVKVTEFMTVEKFSHVIHLTSEVEGKLKSGEDGFSLFKACFPAGTVSGAPKVRAMQIIREFEGKPRGFYAGAVGYFSFSEDMDFAIAIRTIFMEKNVARIQAGAGIVYDSIPEREFFETKNKAMALFRAIELAKEL
ncbi:MAG: chorismate-binding protein [Elusimicrobia bacterium]|nr:chorismate-binding protein [Elusimicrobiota bacterium]